MRRVIAGLLSAAFIGLVSATAGLASGDGLLLWKPRPRLPIPAPAWSFERVGTFANYTNNASIADATVAEIVAATADGQTLVYTDGAMGEIGFVGLANPANPVPLGKLAFPNRPGEPTSVEVLGNTFALVAIKDEDSEYSDPSGYLAVVDLATRTVVREIDLGGQPDSAKISPDGRYLAIAIENERDEDVNDGELPQSPAGKLVVIELNGAPAAWVPQDVVLTGLSQYGSEDPEPEFVDINTRNEAVVTLQENNHIVIVDLATQTVTGSFSAGEVDLQKVDASEDGLIALADNLKNVPREPDAVTWLPGPGNVFNIATANEGDLFGGSRGFSVFRRNGAVIFDSGESLEQLAVRAGHYPEDRSENKGTEPEAIEYGRFGGTDYLFVGSERGSFVAVYKLGGDGRPDFVQILPAPFGPEGLLAIPSRNLLIASGEEDDPSYGVRSTVMVYHLREGAPAYPQILSADSEGAPIAWSALSGMTAVPGQLDSVLAVWDSYYSASRIFRIDVSQLPALITDALTITGGSGNYDPEGIVVAPDNTLWVASEGNASDSRQNRLLQLDPVTGQVLREAGLPAEIIACRAAASSRGTLGSGFEGVAVLPGQLGGYRLLVAQQRGWNYDDETVTVGGLPVACEPLDDDAVGLNAVGEPNRSRIWIYDPVSGSWDHIAWELAPKPVNSSWVGLSEVTATPDGSYVVLERDNRTGNFGVLKTLVRADLAGDADRLIAAGEKVTFDFRPALTANRGWITDKPEGVAVLPDGRTLVVTDNDGVEDWSGETWFLDLGNYLNLF